MGGNMTSLAAEMTPYVLAMVRACTAGRDQAISTFLSRASEPDGVR
jgi:hypothetical protein